MARRWLLRTALLALAALFAYESWIFAHVVWWVKHNPPTTAFIQEYLDDSSAMPRHPPPLQQHWITYGRISPELKRAVIASEDARFVEHHGFDWEGIRVAMRKNLRRGRTVAGGSTITQQLAKNLFLSPERSYVRKAQEAFITVMLEATMSKRRILDLYLNVVEWGEGIYGAQAAARHYFGIDAAALNAWQSALLASMLPNPRYFGRHLDSEYLQAQARDTLDDMEHVRVP